jgi:hypothetical protein
MTWSSATGVASTCAALGYGQLHIIDSLTGKYKQSSRTSKQTEKWLDVHLWRNAEQCMQRVRTQGRQLIVTYFDEAAIPASVQPSSVSCFLCTLVLRAASSHAAPLLW